MKATKLVERDASVRVYGGSFLSMLLSLFPNLLATENVHGFLALLPPRTTTLLPKLSGLEEYRASREAPRLEALRVEALGSRVAIIGGGYAGLVAALELYKYNVKSVIVDYGGRLGGFTAYIEQYSTEARSLIEKVKSVTSLVEGSYIGLYDEGHAILARDTLYTTRGPVVYAGGGEAPPPLTINNDLPGIVSAGYGLELAREARARLGKAVVLGYGYWAPLVADTLAARGVETILVALKSGGVTGKPEKAEFVVVDSVERFYGGRRVEGLVVDEGERLEADIVLSALGEYPDAHPLYGAGYTPVYRRECWAYGVDPPTPGETVAANIIPAGSVLGYEDPAVAQASGEYAAALVAYMLGKLGEQDLEHYYTLLKKAMETARGRCPRASRPPVWLNNSILGLQFVDLDEDVTLEHVYSVWSKGYKSIEMLKRYTGLGTGSEQGRFSAAIASIVLAYMEGLEPQEIGLFRARPPYSVPETALLARAVLGG